jgi:hypothetical protein
MLWAGPMALAPPFARPQSLIQIIAAAEISRADMGFSRTAGAGPRGHEEV